MVDRSFMRYCSSNTILFSWSIGPWLSSANLHIPAGRRRIIHIKRTFDQSIYCLERSISFVSNETDRRPIATFCRCYFPRIVTRLPDFLTPLQRFSGRVPDRNKLDHQAPSRALSRRCHIFLCSCSRRVLTILEEFLRKSSCHTNHIISSPLVAI